MVPAHEAGEVQAAGQALDVPRHNLLTIATSNLHKEDGNAGVHPVQERHGMGRLSLLPDMTRRHTHTQC